MAKLLDKSLFYSMTLQVERFITILILINQPYYSLMPRPLHHKGPRKNQEQERRQQEQRRQQEEQRQEQERKKKQKQEGIGFHNIGVRQWTEGYKKMESDKQEALNRFYQAQRMYKKAVDLKAGELSEEYLNAESGIQKWINMLASEKAQYQYEISEGLRELNDPTKNRHGAQKRDALLKVVAGMEKQQSFQNAHFSKSADLNQFKQKVIELNQQQSSLKARLSQAQQAARDVTNKCKKQQLQAYEKLLGARLNIQQFSGSKLSQADKDLAQRVDQLKADRIEAINAHDRGVKYWTKGYNASKLKEKLDFFYKARDEYVISNAFDPLLSGDGDYLNGEGGIKKWIREAEQQKAQMFNDLNKAISNVNSKTQNVNLRQNLNNREHLVEQLKRVNYHGFGYDAELSQQKEVVRQIKETIEKAQVKFKQGVELWGEAQYSKTATEKLQKYYQVEANYRDLARIDGEQSHAATYLRHMRERHIPQAKIEIQIEFNEEQIKEINAHIDNIVNLGKQNQRIYDGMLEESKAIQEHIAKATKASDQLINRQVRILMSVSGPQQSFFLKKFAKEAGISKTLKIPQQLITGKLINNERKVQFQT